MSELVSVVVPVYNVLPFLKRCLDSIICQTYSNLEIIIVDDGSADGIVRGFAQQLLPYGIIINAI